MPTPQATTGRTYDGRKGGAELVEATAIALDFVGMRVKVPAILTEDRNSQSAGQGAGWLVRISENPRVSDSNGEAWRLLVISGVSGVFGVSDWWRLGGCLSSLLSLVSLTGGGLSKSFVPPSIGFQEIATNPRSRSGAGSLADDPGCPG